MRCRWIGWKISPTVNRGFHSHAAHRRLITSMASIGKSARNSLARLTTVSIKLLNSSNSAQHNWAIPAEVSTQREMRRGMHRKQERMSPGQEVGLPPQIAAAVRL